LLKGIHLRHPSAARRTRAVVAAFFNWAVADDRIAASPCATLKKQARNRRRTRKLSDDEIRWLWTACEKEQHPFGYMVQLLILTICRRDEISRLRSREVRLGNIRKIILPPDRVKNHTEHEVFITDSMLAVFNAIPRVKSKDGWYFTTNGDNPSSGFSRAKRRLDSAMLTIARAEARERGEDPNAVYIDPWRFHDLRRTGASRMRGLGIDTDVIEACLNHITDSGGLRGLYQQHDFGPEKEAAFIKWNLEVARIVSIQSFVEIGKEAA
jgi:integrase